MGRTRKYKRYSPEFKREARKRASEDGTTDKQVCVKTSGSVLVSSDDGEMSSDY
jgi:transposase-like protein